MVFKVRNLKPALFIDYLFGKQIDKVEVPKFDGPHMSLPHSKKELGSNRFSN